MDRQILVTSSGVPLAIGAEALAAYASRNQVISASRTEIYACFEATGEDIVRRQLALGLYTDLIKPLAADFLDQMKERRLIEAAAREEERREREVRASERMASSRRWIWPCAIGGATLVATVVTLALQQFAG